MSELNPTDEPLVKKMKTTMSPKSSVTSPGCSEQAQAHATVWLQGLWTTLKGVTAHLISVHRDARLINDRAADDVLRGAMERILDHNNEAFECLNSLLNMDGELLNAPDFSAPPTTVKSISTSDASTDMILTPGYWDSDAVIESKAASARRSRKPKVAGEQAARDAETDAMETDGEEWSKVVGRRSRQGRKTTAAAPPPATGLRQRPPVYSKKPPAILIQNAAGKSYRDTILAVRNCGLTREEIGTSVTMRQTRDGCLLLELPKGSSSTKAAKKIASAMSSKLGDTVGKVVQLGVQVEVEVLDIDAAATASEVLEALRNAIPGQADPSVMIDRDVVSDVRIWGTRSGQQIATAKMPRSIAASIARVPIGWTMCRVRPRTLPPERCFRCQAFGHNSRSCTAEDRTGACWKCGAVGHSMKDCVEGDDRCVACETAGLPRVAHKPGSGACAARRQSVVAKTSDD